eukprot:5683447-Pleurochrysis_carterae.AAC.1
MSPPEPARGLPPPFPDATSGGAPFPAVGAVPPPMFRAPRGAVISGGAGWVGAAAGEPAASPAP